MQTYEHEGVFCLIHEVEQLLPPIKAGLDLFFLHLERSGIMMAQFKRDCGRILMLSAAEVMLRGISTVHVMMLTARSVQLSGFD